MSEHEQQQGQSPNGDATASEMSSNAAAAGEPDAAGTPAGQAGEAPAGEAPTTQAAPVEARADGEEARPGSADDLRDALTNLSSALDRFGRAAEARLRQEWTATRPEANRAVDEVKRGAESLIKKSAEALETLSRRLTREQPSGGSATTEATSGATQPPAEPGPTAGETGHEPPASMAGEEQTR